jgi:hypothetical protein
MFDYLRSVLREWLRLLRLHRAVWKARRQSPRLRMIEAAVRGEDVYLTGRLYATKFSPKSGRTIYGLVSTTLLPAAAVGFLADCLQGLATINCPKYHSSGTGTSAPTAGDTALEAEVDKPTDRQRGTQEQGRSGNVFRTIATIRYREPLDITEHGVFMQQSGVMFDRSVFPAIEVEPGDAIEFTYELTIPSC